MSGYLKSKRFKAIKKAKVTTAFTILLFVLLLSASLSYCVAGADLGGTLLGGEGAADAGEGESNPVGGEDGIDGGSEEADPVDDGNPPADGGEDTPDPVDDDEDQVGDGGSSEAEPVDNGDDPPDDGGEGQTTPVDDDGEQVGDGGSEEADPVDDGNPPADGGEDTPDPVDGGDPSQDEGDEKTESADGDDPPADGGEDTPELFDDGDPPADGGEDTPDGGNPPTDDEEEPELRDTNGNVYELGDEDPGKMDDLGESQNLDDESDTLSPKGLEKIYFYYFEDEIKESVSGSEYTSYDKYDIPDAIAIEIDGYYYYIFDTDRDGQLDTFYNPYKSIKTEIERNEDSLYLIDLDGDKDWDFIYSSAEGKVKEFGESSKGFSNAISLIFVFSAILIILVLCYWIYKDQRKLLGQRE